MQNVSLVGAAILVEKFLKKKDATYINAFEVPATKTWLFPAGMTITDKITVTNNGTLVIPVASIMEGIKAKGALKVNKEAEVVVAEMNKATSKSDLSAESISIACTDAVIATNEALARELRKAGNNVLVLKYTEKTGYSTEAFVQKYAAITNLPDSVVFGTAPITLAFNMADVEASIDGESSAVASITEGVLKVLKPGEVTIKLTVTPPAGKAEEPSNPANATQKLKVTKRVLTLVSGITAADKTYDGQTSGITLTVNDVKFKGALTADGTGITLAANPTGVLADANAGEKKAVIVTASLATSKKDSTAYYDLAPITFVTAKVAKKAATVTATDATRAYGEENPAFEATESGLVTGDKLDGTLKFQCTADKGSKAATDYAIIPSGYTSDNYAITFTSGKLTVTAVAPTIELVSAVVTKTDNGGTVALTGKVNSLGGSEKLTDNSFKFKYGESGSIDGTLGKDGYYTGTSSVLSVDTYSFTAVASTGNSLDATSNAINVTIDAKTPQSLSFVNVLDTIVYGTKQVMKVSSSVAAATGAYTYSVPEGAAATIDANGTLTPTGVGSVVVTVTRAGDVDHSAAEATKTVTIAPKPVTATYAGVTKAYDGTTAIKLTNPTLTGLVDQEVATIDEVDANFDSKQVGTRTLILPELKLTGVHAANYVLVQPAGLKGSITKKALTVRVNDVTRKWNDQAANTKYTFEATGLVSGESLSAVYTGTLVVTEEASQLKLAVDPAKCANYAISAAAEQGTVTIVKGTPKLVIYKKGDEIIPLLVSAEGHTTTSALEAVDVTVGGVTRTYAQVVADGQTFRSPYGILKPIKTFSMPETRAGGSWVNGNEIQVTYGSAIPAITGMNDYTYESLDNNILTVTQTAAGNAATVQPTTTSIGRTAILAYTTDYLDVQVMTVQVAPKVLTYTGTMTKTYDGNTQIAGAITLKDGNEEFNGNATLGLEGIQFNLADKNVGSGKQVTPSQNLVLVGADANNYTLTSSLTATVNKATLTISSLSAYYKGTQTGVNVTDYSATGLVAGEKEPVTVAAPAAGWKVGKESVSISLGSKSNYTTTTTTTTTIPMEVLKPTIVVTTPVSASSVQDATAKVKKALTIRETGEAISADAIGFVPTVKDLGNQVFQVSGGATGNYLVVYTSNQIGFRADPPAPDPVNVESIALDKTTLALTLDEAYTLQLTVNPSNAENYTVTWSSSDPAVATVSGGNVTAVKQGSATITVTVLNNGKTFTATCSVSVGSPVGVEDVIGNSRVYGANGTITIEPAMPLHVTIVNMTGLTLYNEKALATTTVAAQSGLYLVVLTDGKEVVTHKIVVR